VLLKQRGRNLNAINLLSRCGVRRIERSAALEKAKRPGWESRAACMMSKMPDTPPS
jgi:hypothetical protein